MKNFHKILFINTMTIGTLIAVSSMSWLTAWIGLEINLLSLLPLMQMYKNKSSSEAMIKYFIVQAMASAMLLFSIIIFTNTKNFNNVELNVITSIMMDTALMLKLGAAPLHFWFPEIASGLSWEMNFVLMTWQKIAPMMLLTYSTQIPTFLSIIIIISSMISGLQGMNQTCLRKILTYSSINHVSWMISALLNSMNVWLYYFLIYCIINFNIIIMLNKYNIMYLKQLGKIFAFSKKLKFFFMLNFLSLGGLPPFLGFFPKWMTVNHMVTKNYHILAMLLILFTLVTLYFYMRITFTSFSINTEESMIMVFNKMNYFYFYSNLISLIGLVMCTIASNFY